MMNIFALLVGTLCTLSNGKLTNCTTTNDAVVHVEPAAEARRVVWTSGDGKRLVVATIAAKAETIDLDPKNWREVALRVTGDPARGWPADLRIGFGRDAVVTVPAKAVAKLTTISVPPARYAVTFQAEHYVTARHIFDLTAQPRLDAGEIRLRALPLVTGTVVTTHEGKDVPVAGADVSFGNGKPLTNSDEKGAFRAEIPESLPEAIVVSHGALGSKTIPLEHRGTDTNLGTIHLLPGVTLAVKVARPPELRAKPLTVTLYRRDPAVYEPTRVGAHELAGSDDEVTFEPVAAGAHIVVVQGAEPLARISVPVKVEEEKPAGAEVRIEPYTLAGRATFGGEPLGGADVGVHPRADLTWRVQLTAAADGTFGGTAWQHGVLTGTVNDARLGTVFFTDSPELGADPSVWNIEIKKRLITGRVYDAETKEPMGKIELIESAALLDDQNHTIPFRGGIRTDADGNFTMLAARPGRYELRFARPDYLPKSVVVNIAPEDGSKQADFPVERGTAQALVLRWPDGTPIASATVYDGDAPEPGGLPPTYRSDATGAAMIRGKSGEVHTLYVIPVEGSIAVVHLPIAGRDAKPFEAVVGRPAAALRIVAVDPDGKPSGGGVILRLNGDLIPLEILMRRYGPSAGFDAAGERVLDRLPPAMYEVWLVRGRGPLPAQPNARVGISTGEERVRIVVAKR